MPNYNKTRVSIGHQRDRCMESILRKEEKYQNPNKKSSWLMLILLGSVGKLQTIDWLKVELYII